jgi:hypothetical protein
VLIRVPWQFISEEGDPALTTEEDLNSSADTIVEDEDIADPISDVIGHDRSHLIFLKWVVDSLPVLSY